MIYDYGNNVKFEEIDGIFYAVHGDEHIYIGEVRLENLRGLIPIYLYNMAVQEHEDMKKANEKFDKLFAELLSKNLSK